MTSKAAGKGRSDRWGARQTLAAVAVAVVVGGVGGAAIYAATEGSPMGGPRTMHASPRPAGRPPPAEASSPDALHGEYVVSDGHGGYVTKLRQTGVVDEVTPSSIVVRSDDGYTQIYAFPPAAAGPSRSVVANDTVTVDATRAGATVTLTRIGEGPPHGN